MAENQEIPQSEIQQNIEEGDQAQENSQERSGVIGDFIDQNINRAEELENSDTTEGHEFRSQLQQVAELNTYLKEGLISQEEHSRWVALLLTEAVQKGHIDQKVTGLLNGEGFRSRLKDSIDLALRSDGDVALGFVDLKGFKGVNDMINHEAGDIVLRHVADYLSDNVRTSDILSRYQGDEFVIAFLNSDLSTIKEKFDEMIEGEDFQNYIQEQLSSDENFIQLLNESNAEKEEEDQVGLEDINVGARVGYSELSEEDKKLLKEAGGDTTQVVEALINEADQAANRERDREKSIGEYEGRKDG